jgi:hypothetical protein
MHRSGLRCGVNRFFFLRENSDSSKCGPTLLSWDKGRGSLPPGRASSGPLERRAFILDFGLHFVVFIIFIGLSHLRLHGGPHGPHGPSWAFIAARRPPIFLKNQVKIVQCVQRAKRIFPIQEKTPPQFDDNLLHGVTVLHQCAQLRDHRTVVRRNSRRGRPGHSCR